MHHEAHEVLPEVLRGAGIRHAVLIGHSDGGSIAAIYAGTPISSFPAMSRPSPQEGPGAPGHAGTTLFGLVTIAAHFFVEDLNIASIRQIAASYETGDLRQRLSRYHRDVEAAFRGWNDAWLDPRFRAFDITGRPICLFFDQREESPDPALEGKTLGAFLSDREDWPPCHLFIAVRDEEGTALKVVRDLTGRYPAAEIYPLEDSIESKIEAIAKRAGVSPVRKPMLLGGSFRSTRWR